MNLRGLLLGALIAGAGLADVGCGKPDVDAKVLSFHMPAAPAAELPNEPGQVWAALEVEMCSNVSADDGVAVGHQNWVLEMPDEPRISPAMDVERL
jgi:hypothetical protein